MLRVATIAAATLGILMAMAGVAGGGGALGADAKPQQPLQPIFVVAPMDGIFWRGEYPGGAPDVEIGQAVEVK